MKKTIAGRGEFTASTESYEICFARSRKSLVASLVDKDRKAARRSK